MTERGSKEEKLIPGNNWNVGSADENIGRER